MQFLYCDTGDSHTFVLVDLPIDLGEDAGVAENHDKQREDVQRDKVKHVVCCLLPQIQETSMGHTLSEVHSFSFNGPKDEQLRVKRAKDMKDESDVVTVQQQCSHVILVK